jgi:hypothetical protein
VTRARREEVQGALGSHPATAAAVKAEPLDRVPPASIDDRGCDGGPLLALAEGYADRDRVLEDLVHTIVESNARPRTRWPRRFSSSASDFAP